MEKIVKGGIYQHYKGPKYRVLEIVKHSETLEDLVMYECLYENPGGQFWVRPMEMFVGDTEYQGRQVKRFTLTADAEV